MTDTEILDKLEELASKGYAPGLINDDCGHWALSFEGAHPIICKPPDDAWIDYWAEQGHWKKSIREAILDGFQRLDGE